VMPYTVSMGVYALEPAAIAELEAGCYCDLPDLVTALLGRGAAVGSFPFDGYWLDIGREDDFRRAQADAEWLFPGLPKAVAR
jgi:NDP-mannose synthase